MTRGDLSEQEWVLIEVLLPAERGRKSRPSLDNAVISTVCSMLCELAVPGATCRSATANGIQFMSGFDAGRNKAYGMRFWKHLSNWA